MFKTWRDCHSVLLVTFFSTRQFVHESEEKRSHERLTVDPLALVAEDVDDGAAVPLHRRLELRRRERAQHRLHLGRAAAPGGRAGLESGA